MKKFKLLSVTFLWASEVNALIIFGKVFYININTEPYYRPFKLARRVLPYFIFRGIHCCDHGGRMMNHCYQFAWNYWHMSKITDKDWGDGPDTIRFISPIHYLKARNVRGEK